MTKFYLVPVGHSNKDELTKVFEGLKGGIEAERVAEERNQDIIIDDYNGDTEAYCNDENAVEWVVFNERDYAKL